MRSASKYLLLFALKDKKEKESGTDHLHVLLVLKRDSLYGRYDVEKFRNKV